MGVRVAYNPQLPYKGLWVAERSMIVLRPHLHPVVERCTLAHELGHAACGHVSTPPAWLHARQEREADQYAARLLIPPDAYAAAEFDHGPHPGGIAKELGVTTHLVEVWRTLNRKDHP
ncbi:ImmA/IrrE family metallo-endopeptidase [Corynebacterium sp. 13CS0277]|nr:ImmA/IrrE family metallo-endopeptidase [Corynebacterium sp. 13CS0277]PRQ10646.1 ImmA/IrrE family metallo-endopeptidase [Corynebacterium sp. 13CS0277]